MGEMREKNVSHEKKMTFTNSYRNTAVFHFWSFTGSFLNVPATCLCISGTDLFTGNCAYCHTETDVADQTCYLFQSQQTDISQAYPSIHPSTLGAWQGFVCWLLNVPATC